jgi:transposase
MLELPECNSNTFQIFLNGLSSQNPKELKLVVLDNGAFHKAKKLVIPKNIVLLFLPAYSPELNPAEKIWQNLKRKFTNQFLRTTDELQAFVCKIATTITTEQVKTICRFKYIFLGNYWSVQ